MTRSKTVVVTGATSGIGAAVADAFRDSGARLFLIGRDERKLRNAASRVPSAQLAGTGLADLALPASIEALVADAGKRLRRVDVLVHAAGEYGWTELGTADVDGFDALFHTNVRGPYLLTQCLLPLIERARGHIVFVNSSIVRGVGNGVAAFKATQHALQGMTDSLRQDLNARGIRVTSLFPGRTATPRMRRIYARGGQSYVPDLLLRPRDVARLVVTLTSFPPAMEITDVHIRSLHQY